MTSLDLPVYLLVNLINESPEKGENESLDFYTMLVFAFLLFVTSSSFRKLHLLFKMFAKNAETIELKTRQ